MRLLERVLPLVPGRPIQTPAHRVAFRFRYKRQRPSKYLDQLPEFLRFLGLCLSNSMSLLQSLRWLSENMSGSLADLISDLVAEVELGADISMELQRWFRLNDPALSELATRLLFSIERGTSISQMLAEQSDSVSYQLTELRLAKSNSSETKMLVPLIFLILPMTVLLASYPSLAGLNLTFN